MWGWGAWPYPAILILRVGEFAIRRVRRWRLSGHVPAAQWIAHSAHLLAARFILYARDPVGGGRHGPLPEEEVQLGRMFLHVTHVVQL